MTQSLNPDEIAKMPEDGIDFRDFILHVASNNNWVFDLTELTNDIIKNAKKRGSLGRINICLQEMEDDGVLIKHAHKRIYSVTTLGINVHQNGGYKLINVIGAGVKDALSAKQNPFDVGVGDILSELKRNKTESKLLSRIFSADKVAAISAFITATAVSFQVYYISVQVSLQRQELTTETTLQALQDTLKNKENDLKSLNLTIDSLNKVIQELTKK